MRVRFACLEALVLENHLSRVVNISARFAGNVGNRRVCFFVICTDPAFILFQVGRYGVPFYFGAPPLKHYNYRLIFLEFVCFQINFVYLQCPSGLLYRRHARWMRAP